MASAKDKTSPPLQITLLTVLLVAATIGLGLVAWFSLRTIMLSLATSFVFALQDVTSGQRRGLICLSGNITAILAGLLWIGVAVGGIEYHFRHVGERKSWRILAWTLGIEAALIVVSLLLS